MFSIKKRASRKATETTESRPLSERDANKILRMAFQAQAEAEQKNWQKAEQKWQEIIDYYKDRTPAAIYVRKSLSLRMQQRYSTAEAFVRGALAIFPKDVDLSAEYAQIATSQRNWQIAIERWRNVIERFQDTNDVSVAYARLIEAYIEIGDTELAKKVAIDACKMYPTSDDISYARALINSKTRQWAAAKKEWEKFLSSFPDRNNIGATIKLSEALRNLDDFTTADKIINNLLSAHPRNIELCIESAEIATSKQDWKKATARWQDVLNVLEIPEWASLYARFNLSIIDRLDHIDKYSRAIDAYRKNTQTKRVAVITSYTKGYDTLKPPATINNSFDYIVYTDDSEAYDYGIYDIRPLPTPELDGPRAIRYVKTHPHVLAQEYDLCVWMDTNIMIEKDITTLLASFESSQKPIASTPHTLRNTIFEEVEACINLGKDDPELMKKQVSYYQQEGFKGNVLAENGILFFNLRNKHLPDVVETWWQEIVNRSKRDQLSFGYALFKNRAQWHHIVERPLAVRTIPEFILTSHGDTSPLLLVLQTRLKKALRSSSTKK